MEIDQDYLQTGTVIGSRASHKHGLRFLVLQVTIKNVVDVFFKHNVVFLMWLYYFTHRMQKVPAGRHEGIQISEHT